MGFSGMTVEVTVDTLCVLLEERGIPQVEETSFLIVDALAQLGDDLLDHLDPPLGLRTWLSSHGLSLVETRQVSPPAVWEALQGEEEPDDLEEEQGGSLLLQVGGFIEYRTAQSGPHNQSQVGSGRIKALLEDDTVIVETGPGQEIWIDAVRDFIRPLPQPGGP